jgi:hypothetical protein
VDDELQRRLGANEAVFREVNEGIERGQWPGDEDQLIGFRCECARLGCNSLVKLSKAEYEQVRSHPRRFVMIAGHEIPEVETVVAVHNGYVVVQKRDEAGETARAVDPRG